jgi:NAD(P)-dependent dehydrogenase (short-subunit alcohol dehydrogenase family)
MKILITGASSGIGKSLAENLERKGFQVQDLSRTSGTTLRRFFKISTFFTPELFGAVVLNAADLGPRDFPSTEDWRAPFEVVAGSIDLLNQLVLGRYLTEDFFLLYTLTTDLIPDLALGGPYFPAYVASKLGIQYFSRTILPERSYRIYPGLTRTRGVDYSFPTDGMMEPDYVAKRIMKAYFLNPNRESWERDLVILPEGEKEE